MTYVVGNRWGSAKRYGLGDVAPGTPRWVTIADAKRMGYANLPNANWVCTDGKGTLLANSACPQPGPDPSTWPSNQPKPAATTSSSWLENLFAKRPAAPAMPAASVAGSFTTPLLIAGGVIGAVVLVSMLRK